MRVGEIERMCVSHYAIVGDCMPFVGYVCLSIEISSNGISKNLGDLPVSVSRSMLADHRPLPSIPSYLLLTQQYQII